MRAGAAGELLLQAALMAGGYWALHDIAPRGDESAHLLQILAVHQGEWTPRLTMFPGYHAAMAWLWDVSGAGATMPAGRALSFLLALPAPVAFYLAARRVDAASAARRTSCFLALPVLFPYLFLVYTDVLAVGLLLAATAAMLHRRATLAAAFCLLALLVRQSYAVWAALLFLLPATESGTMTPTVLRAHLRERWALAALLVAFAVFVIANGGVALGGKMRHPFGRVHVENVIVAAVLFFVLFLPLLLADARRTARRALRSAWVWAGTLMMVAAWWWAFRVDHPFNGDMHYLHNRIADALDPAQPPAGAACAGALVAVGSAALLAWPFAERRFALVLPFFAASLLPAWLIEHRYAIPGLALLLLFRAPASPAAERALLAWLAVLAAAVVLVIRTGVAFP